MIPQQASSSFSVSKASIADRAIHFPKQVLRRATMRDAREQHANLVRNFALLARVNPTRALMRARAFVGRHDYIFALVCMLNVNLGAFDVPAVPDDADVVELARACDALALLEDVAACHTAMDAPRRRRVLRRLECAGALPVAWMDVDVHEHCTDY